MLLGAICPVTILALMTTMIFHAVSADDDNEKWGDNVGGKAVDNRFIVGNWKKRNEKWKHQSNPPGKMEKGVDVLETGGRSGRSMERENDPQQQKWGNWVGEGVDSFCIRSLRRMDTNDDVPSNATLPRRGNEELSVISPRQTSFKPYSLRGSNYSSMWKPFTSFTLPDLPQGCMVKHTKVAKERNGNFKYFNCFCNVITMPNVFCCHLACCKDIVEKANRCRGNFSHSCNATNAILQGPTSVYVMVQTEVKNITESTTEMEPNDIPPSTAVTYSGSAREKRQQGLALVAAVILIYFLK